MWDVNVETQKSRKGTAMILLKRFFFALIIVCVYVPSTPIFSADTDETVVVEKATKESIEKITEQAVEKAVKKATEETMEHVAAKVSKEKTEEAELKAKRPNELKGATDVYFVVFVLDVNNIDDATQSFTANVYLRLRWKDVRLAHKEGTIRQIPLDQVWNPRILLVNQLGTASPSLPEIVQVHPDGTVIYHQRYTGRLSQRMMLANFPMDKQSFDIQFVGTGYQADELTFKPEFQHTAVKNGGAMAKTLSLANWKVLTYKTVVAPYKPIEEINTASFAFQFQADRYVSYYLWQMVLPLAVIVIMSSAAFWISRKDLAIRVAVATASVLTLIAHRFVLASLLPRLPYMTRLDFFTVGSTILVLLALIMAVVIGSHLISHKESLAQKLDIFFRAGIPGMFFLLVAWFITG
jgi:hypothetical protein